MDAQTESQAEAVRNLAFMSWDEESYYVVCEGEHSPENSKRAVELVEQEAGDWDEKEVEPVWMRWVSEEQAREALEREASDMPEEAADGGGWVECGRDEGIAFYKVS